jgi:hypothetical protein
MTTDRRGAPRSRQAQRGRQSSAFAPQAIHDARTSLRPRPKTETIALVDTRIRGCRLNPSSCACIALPKADSYGSVPHHVLFSKVDWNLADWTFQHLRMIKRCFFNDVINRKFALREVSRTFENQYSSRRRLQPISGTTRGLSHRPRYRERP